MAIAAWAASTAFSVGDIRRSTGDEGTGLFFRCTTAGTSASSEPGWPSSAGDTVTDGTCVWTAISATYGDLAISNPSAIIELFQLRLDSALHGSNDIYYFHAGTNEFGESNIVFASNTYSRVPIKADGFEYTNTGTLPRPTLTVSNLSSTITALLLLVNATTAGNDLGGAEVRRIRTLAKYLDSENFGSSKLAITQADDFLVTQGSDNLEFNVVVNNPTADPNARFPDERWFIDRKSSETRDSVTFELASKFDLAGQKIPRRQIIANICQWRYRSSECSYTGTDYYDVNGNEVSTEAQDVCGKRVASCKLRFGENAELPFGSFPGAGLTK
jgi:phage-related protein|tara:strand:+ start:2346 stop:3335 length:990 start_codon:yes stop_codon:yes gene_type:complete